MSESSQAVDIVERAPSAARKRARRGKLLTYTDTATNTTYYMTARDKAMPPTFYANGEEVAAARVPAQIIQQLWRAYYDAEMEDAAQKGEVAVARQPSYLDAVGMNVLVQIVQELTPAEVLRLVSQRSSSLWQGIRYNARFWELYLSAQGTMNQFRNAILGDWYARYKYTQAFRDELMSLNELQISIISERHLVHASWNDDTQSYEVSWLGQKFAPHVSVNYNTQEFRKVCIASIGLSLLSMTDKQNRETDSAREFLSFLYKVNEHVVDIDLYAFTFTYTQALVSDIARWLLFADEGVKMRVLHYSLMYAPHFLRQLLKELPFTDELFFPHVRNTFSALGHRQLQLQTLSGTIFYHAEVKDDGGKLPLIKFMLDTILPTDEEMSAVLTRWILLRNSADAILSTKTRAAELVPGYLDLSVDIKSAIEGRPRPAASSSSSPADEHQEKVVQL